MQLRNSFCSQAAREIAKANASLQCSIPSYVHTRAVDCRHFFTQNNIALNHQFFIPDNNVHPRSMDLHIPNNTEPRYRPHVAHRKKRKLKFFHVAYKGLAE